MQSHGRVALADYFSVNSNSGHAYIIATYSHVCRVKILTGKLDLFYGCDDDDKYSVHFKI